MMNERIWELWHEATLHPANEDSNDLVRTFAELLIRECIETMYNTEQITVAQFVDATLKQHFGVE